jgi:RHS repeat-associated protein
MGSITEVTYKSSIDFYLRDERSPQTRWRSSLPFPVQVVESTTIHDKLSGSRLTTEYRYRHGYWDGVEREFRGFGMVEQLDTEVKEGYLGHQVDPTDDFANQTDRIEALKEQHLLAPPMLSRMWFHQGPVNQGDDDRWHETSPEGQGYWPGDGQMLYAHQLPEVDRRDALRSLRGSMLRSEVYALDGSQLEDRPYSVTEQAYAISEVKPRSVNGEKGVYFPHQVAQRTTQWERGNDPMTQFSFTHDFDEYGQPQRAVAIACSRGWRDFKATAPEGFWATVSHTEYVRSSSDQPYIKDRVARSRSFEITGTEGESVSGLLDIRLNDPRLRLIGETLNYYDATEDAATDFGAFTGRPLGEIGNFGTLVRSETLVMDDTILAAAYESDVPAYIQEPATAALAAKFPQAFIVNMPPRAGYIHHPPSASVSGGYYAITASSRFDFHRAPQIGSGILLGQRDPFGNETQIEYDRFDLLPAKVTGPTGMQVSAEYDYRTFKPKKVTDPNGNVTEVAYSPSGLVTDTWLRGKPDLKEGDVVRPGTHIEYGLRAYYDSVRAGAPQPQPVFAKSIRYVTHDSDPDDKGESIETREYSDGFGRLLQTRTEGENVRFGDAGLGGGHEVLPGDQSDNANTSITGVANTDRDRPNVIVSGWQKYDNKGRVVEKFEPFYDVGWEYQPSEEAKQGVSVKMSYDPRGQVIKTANPDGSEQLVIFGIPNSIDDPPRFPLDTGKYKPTPWEAYTYDANDNAGRTHAGEKSHASYAHHFNTPASIEIDPLGRTIKAVVRNRAPPDPRTGELPPVEEHITRSTYDIQGNLTGVYDALGRLAFEYVYDLGKHPLRTESIDAGRKTLVMDAAGNPIEARDAKGALTLHAFDKLNRPTHLWARDAVGEPITLREKLHYDGHPDEPDQAETRNLIGKLVRHHDEAGLVSIEGYDFKGNILSSARQVISDDFMLGNVRRQSGAEWKAEVPRVDWEAPPANILDPFIYRATSAFDALNRAKWTEYPTAANGERYRLKPDYNRAGALERVDLHGPLDGNDNGPVEPYVERIAYNAKGQRTMIAYGNGIMTRYAYDAQTFRLSRLHSGRYEGDGNATYKPQGTPLQDLAYRYDLGGNILSITDRTPGSGIQNNPQAPAHPEIEKMLASGDALVREFAYDPLNRLVLATGRESSSNFDPRFIKDAERSGYGSGKHGTANQVNGPKLTNAYRQLYDYDPAGNMLRLTHQKDGATAWSRHFGMAGFAPKEWRSRVNDWLSGQPTDFGTDGNRLTHFGDQDNHSESHRYDANGNMVRENLERHFEWDRADRMKAFRVQNGAARPTTYALYLYDSGGQRVKKLVVEGNAYRTSCYLGGVFEHHAEHADLEGGGRQENCSLHIMDDSRRIAIKRVGPAFADDGAAEHEVQFHLGDHLGSSAVVVGARGEWVNREEHYPYGETSFGGFGRKRYRFTGMERDEESGLVYFGTRYFSPQLAAWKTAEPENPEATMNRSSFVACNPIVHREADGLTFKDFGEGLGNGLAASIVIGFAAGLVLGAASPAIAAGLTVVAAAAAVIAVGKTAAVIVNHIKHSDNQAVCDSAHRYYGEQIGGLVGGGFGGSAGGMITSSAKAVLGSLGPTLQLAGSTSMSSAGATATISASTVNGAVGASLFPAVNSVSAMPPGGKKDLKALTDNHNDVADKLVKELGKLGVKAESNTTGVKLTDSSGKILKGTMGTKTTRAIDIAVESVNSVGEKVIQSIEVKTSSAPATIKKIENQLLNEKSMTDPFYKGTKIDNVTPSGPGYVIAPNSFYILPAATMKN